MHGNPGVIPDLRHQLVVPDVDGHHVGSTAPKQHIREPAGGGAGVEAPFACDVDGGKGIQRAGQLVPGAADVAVLGRGRDVQRGVVRDLQGRLGEDLARRSSPCPRR